MLEFFKKAPLNNNYLFPNYNFFLSFIQQLPSNALNKASGKDAVNYNSGNLIIYGNEEKFNNSKVKGKAIFGFKAFSPSRLAV